MEFYITVDAMHHVRGEWLRGEVKMFMQRPRAYGRENIWFEGGAERILFPRQFPGWKNLFLEFETGHMYRVEMKRFGSKLTVLDDISCLESRNLK